MSDVESVRVALTVLHRRLQEEGYGPEFGQPDPEEVFDAALAALARLEVENDHQRQALRNMEAIARAVLEEEVPLPRRVLDDPKIQAQIAEAKERARKGGEQA